MKLATIKTINTYTNNTKVLKAILELNEDNAQEVLALLETLKKYYPIKEYIIDMTVMAYIKTKFKEGKTLFADLVQIPAFIHKLSIMNAESLKEYISLAEKIANYNCEEAKILRYLLTNDDIIAAYMPNYHVNLLNLAYNFRGDLELLKLIKTATMNHFPLVKELACAYSASTFEEKKEILEKLVNTKGLSYIDCGNIINVICTCKSQEKLDLISISINQIGKYGKHFNDLYEIIYRMCEKGQQKNYLFLEDEFLKNRTTNEILEIISSCANYANHPEQEHYFREKRYLTTLTWKQQKDLFNMYGLENNENMQKLKRVADKIINDKLKETPKEELPNIYDLIIEKYDEAEYYITTVCAYLDTCKTIDEFIKTMSTTYSDTAELTLTDELKLESKK